MTTQWINDKALSHTATNGCRFKAARADLKGGVKLIKPEGTTEANMAADIAEFGAFHGMEIWPRLNGFQGWGSVEFEIVCR
jgi:cytolysin (calcineurin-like family phosphatase)